jgi:hypothetical protein
MPHPTDIPTRPGLLPSDRRLCTKEEYTWIIICYMPAKEILAAIRAAVEAGWRQPADTPGGSAHVYCKLRCPGGRGCCPQLNIYGTPRVAEHEAAKIYRAIAGGPAGR